jgi:glutathione S-transferase
MKLYCNPSSPYSRIVRATSVEVGLDDRIELSFLNPWENPPELLKLNPLGRIPVLETENDGVIYDSTAICEYLNSTGGGSLFPEAGPRRWRALVGRATGIGLLESLVPIRLELLRPEEHRSEMLKKRWHDSAARTLRALDASDLPTADAPHIGDIALGCALGYLDFRFTDWNWRAEFPSLGGWYGPLAKRPSFETTLPA